MQRTTLLCIIVALTAFAEADVGISLGDDMGVNRRSSMTEHSDVVGTIPSEQSRVDSHADQHNDRHRRQIDLFASGNVQPFGASAQLNANWDRTGYWPGNNNGWCDSRLYDCGNLGQVQPYGPNNYGPINRPPSPWYPWTNQPWAPAPYPPGNYAGYQPGPGYPINGYGANSGVGYPLDNRGRYGVDPRYSNYGSGSGAVPQYPADLRAPNF